MTDLDSIAPLPEITRGGGRRRYSKGVVSASTLANWYGYKGNLVNWAKRRFYDGALEGKTFEELDEKDTDIGSLVHAMIENDIHGTALPAIPPQYEEAVSSAFSSWKDWARKNQMTVLATEVNLESEKYGLGGTIDAVLQNEEGALAIGDWKTSATLRSSYLVQLAIYGLVWNENNEDKITAGFHLLRFSKVGGRSAELYFPDLDDALMLALQLRRAHTMANDVRKAAGLAY